MTRTLLALVGAACTSCFLPGCGSAPAGADDVPADGAPPDADPPQPGPEVRLTADSAFSHGTFCYGKSVVASGDLVHVVFYDDRGRAPGPDADPFFREIYYKRSTDRGTTWEPDFRLTDSDGISQFPSFAVTGSTVHVVWSEYRDGNPEVYYKRSTDAGLSWEFDVRLTADASSSFAPSLAASGSAVHVVWYDQRDGNFEVYTKRSTDGGASWGADTRITSDGADSWFPSVAVSGPQVHIAWEEYRDGNPELYYRRSVDGGDSWGAETRLTFDGAPSVAAGATIAPSISASGASAHVVWSDERDGNQEIYDKRSTDGGATWLPEERLTNEPHESASPNVSVDGFDVDIVWNDDRHGDDPAISEIFHRRSPDGGATWEPETRVTVHDPAIPLSYGIHPSVFVQGSHAHLLWTDSRDRAGVDYDGNYEIYYKRLR
jgi:hypothetical protein